MRFSPFWTLLLLLLSCNGAADALQIAPQLSKHSLVDHAYFLEDASGELSFEQLLSPEQQARFTAFTADDINRGITSSSYWLKFSLHNPSDQELSWVLTPETSYIDELTMFLKTPQGQWQRSFRSDYQAFSQRDFAYRLLNFKQSIAPNSSLEGYLRFSTRTLETVNIQAYVYEQTGFSDYLVKEHLLFGLYYGLFIAMAIFVFALWVYAGEQSSRYYGYFFVYLSFTMLMWGSLNGFNFQFLWPNTPSLFNQGFHILYLCVAIFSIQFSRHLLNTRQLLPRADSLLKCLLGLYIVAIPLRLLGAYDLVLYISYFSLLSMAFQPILGWLCYRRGNRYILFYIIAWIPYAISLLVSLASASGQWSQFGMSTLHTAQFAVLFECFMLILAMLVKMKHSSYELQAEAELSKRDPLTQLGNRRYLEQRYQQLVQSKGAEVEFWLLLIDLDNFKQINDQYGHAAGDQILKELAEVLEGECRSVDVAIRWGGEEFAILTNVLSEKMAVIVAERIRSTFATQSSRYKNKSIKHTLSIGLARLEANNKKGLDDCLDRADRALYYAKQHGRDQVVVYSADMQKLPKTGLDWH